jgi:sec-independent protein translocase protein TatB
MFDIGFFELLMVGLVALLVIGPERLPMVARKAGMWAGRARRFVNSVKRDIDREIQAEEYKRLLDEQDLKNPMHEIIEDTRKEFSEIRGKVGEDGSGASRDADQGSAEK